MANMTGKERLLATLAGERADRVPFVPNIWQWFHVHRDAGTLPADWADVPEPVEALRRLGADVMSKFDGVVLRPQLQDCRLSVTYEGDPADVPSWTSFADFELGPIRRERIETPHGTLTHVWEYPAHARASFEAEHWWKDFDSLFNSPALFREFCLPVMRRAAGRIHARGKYMFAHACGRLKALAPWILEAGLDCVEGQAHPPLGDWRLDETRALSERLIVCGGMTAREQEWTAPEAVARIDRHVRDLFASLGDKRRFLFASGCNSSPQMPFENLIAFRDAALKYGPLC